MRRRMPLATEVPITTKRQRGRTAVLETPILIRSRVPLGGTTRDVIRTRLARKLAKFATVVERVAVRFEDLNGPRGGVDIHCTITVTLSGLEPSVFKARAATQEQAFAQAARSLEHAILRKMERHARRSPMPTRPAPREAPSRKVAARRVDPGEYIGRRVGRSRENLERLEMLRREPFVDTAEPGVSATDRKAGGYSTAARNTKLNFGRMTSALEDSRGARPSRKSTRRSKNRAKSGTKLRQRATAAVSAPKSRAARAR